MQQHAKIVQNQLKGAKLHIMCMEMCIVAWNVHKCTLNGLKGGENNANNTIPHERG